MENYKEKAKRYDEALKQINECIPDENGFITIYPQEVFPELKESEGERIRKGLINYFNDFTLPTFGGLDPKKILAWLEKQGEQTNLPQFTFDDVLALQCCMETVKKVQEDNELYEQLNLLHSKVYDAYQLEKQGNISPTEDELEALRIAAYEPIKNWSEKLQSLYKKLVYCEYKPADKVEPKFRVGDWITNGACIIQITSVDDRYYWHDNDTVGGDIESIDKEYHLWTIEDTKDGDVLSYRNSQWIFIYKEKIDDSSFNYHILYSTIHQDLTINDAGFTLLSDAIIPATKEQRGLLFQKMKEVGYEWDAEHKQLKKIEQKSVFEMKTPEESLGIDSDTYNEIVDECIYGKQKPTNKVEPFDKYKGLTDFERTLTDVCIGWIGEELGWKQYIKDNADVLLKIAIKKFNSVQDEPLEQKPVVIIPRFKVGDIIHNKKEEYEVNTIKISEVKEDRYISGLCYLPFDKQDEWELVEQNPAWSEEDESILQGIWDEILANKHNAKECEWKTYDKFLDWLKSLKDRYTWKPSDDQMEVLNWCKPLWNEPKTKAVLESLIEDLKKLREE